jgi:two-component system, LytTR family, response regulator
LHKRKTVSFAAHFNSKMNKSLSFILADDDLLYREFTIQQLGLMPNVHCLAVCEDAFSTLEELKKQSPDLLILDVEMPGLTGIQLAKSLSVLPLIIFISSHPSYAADAFDVDAIDYLVKPAATERLIRAIEKARTLKTMKEEIPVKDAFQLKEDDSFFVKDKNTFIRIAYSEVQYIESLGDFVSIIQQNGNKQIALVSMKNLEQQLPASQFVRISRTHMVNKQKITAIDSETVFLNKLQLYMGKTYADAVLQSVIGNTAIKRFL